MTIDILSLFFPLSCAICRAEADSVVCKKCDPAKNLFDSERLLGGARCRRCGEPEEEVVGAPEERVEERCFSCLHSPLPMRRLVSVWRYTESVEVIIKALKYREHLELAHFVGEHLSEAARHLRREEPDLFWNAVVPVTSATEKTKERGFAHTALIAKSVARSLGLPALLFSLRSTKERAQQTSLPLEARAKNVQSAFTAEGVAGCSLLLIDDVLTTGSTITAATLALLRAGASAVDALTLARSPNFPRNRAHLCRFF